MTLFHNKLHFLRTVYIYGPRHPESENTGEVLHTDYFPFVVVLSWMSFFAKDPLVSLQESLNWTQNDVHIKIKSLLWDGYPATLYAG